MKIGIGNNITKEGKNNLKKYFKQKGYKYLDCDEFLKSSTKIGLRTIQELIPTLSSE